LLVVLIIAILCFFGMGFVCYRFIKYEQYQNSQISDLQGKIDEINIRLKNINMESSPETLTFLNSCDDEHYNILFIGNSITIHDYADYWWSDNRGMAATERNKDYVHLTVSGLRNFQNKPVNYSTVFFRTWETLAHDRAETYDIIDNYLNDKLNVVVVQLGENVSDTSTFESDYKYLLEHISSNAQNAEIVTIGDFWEDKTKDSIKKNVAAELNLKYVDLFEIQDNPSYQAGLGTKVKGEDGKMHTIEHEGVAKHPGDNGMAWIADHLLDQLY
jgi:hypothetical protein